MLRFRSIKVIMRLRVPCRALMTANSLSGRTVTAGNLFIAPLRALRLKLLTFGSTEKSIVNTDKVTRVITTELKYPFVIITTNLARCHTTLSNLPAHCIHVIAVATGHHIGGEGSANIQFGRI